VLMCSVDVTTFLQDFRQEITRVCPRRGCLSWCLVGVWRFRRVCIGCRCSLISGSL